MYYFHAISSPSQISGLVLIALPVRMQKRFAKDRGQGALQGAAGDTREGFLQQDPLGFSTSTQRIVQPQRNKLLGHREPFLCRGKQETSSWLILYCLSSESIPSHTNRV